MTGSAEKQGLGVDGLQPGENGADVLLPLDSQDLLKSIFLGAVVDFRRGGLFVAAAARHGAQRVDPQMHSRAVEPSEHVALRVMELGASIELQENFAGEILGAAQVAEHTAKNAKNAGVVREEKFVEAVNAQVRADSRGFSRFSLRSGKFLCHILKQCALRLP